MGRLLRDEGGFSVTVAASILLLVLSLFYVSYQSIEIPAFCKEVEKQSLTVLEEDVVNLVSNLKKLVGDNTPKTVHLHLGDVYPTVPFFSTPNGFSGSVYTYPARVKINNVKVTSVTSRGQANPYNTLEITGSNIIISPKYNFLNAPDIVIEYGVVAVGKGSNYMPLYGKLIDNSTIFIPLFNGNLSVGGVISYELTLYPKSAGGSGVYITNESSSNITIELDSRLPLDFWRKVVPEWVSVTEDNGTVKLSLPKGRTYRLIMGVASLNEWSGRLPPDYLYRVSPVSQSSPCGLVVQVRDVLNNPVPLSNVTFSVLSGSVTLKTVDDRGNLVSSSSLTVKSNEMGFASVTAESSGLGLVKANLTDRSALQPYEVVFIVS